MSNGITRDNLLRSAPGVLVNDSGMSPMVDTLAVALEALAGKCSLVTIYSRIDELPEDLLDILAVDFKVDWYDPNADIATKRNMLKDNFYVHRHRGTRAAVVTAISDVWPDSTLEEWFEYGGDPYHFRVILTAEYSQDEQVRALEAINKAKNVRSVLDAIIFNSGGTECELYTACGICGIEIVYEAIDLDHNGTIYDEEIIEGPIIIISRPAMT